jgi:hypothetical protein
MKFQIQRHSNYVEIRDSTYEYINVSTKEDAIAIIDALRKEFDIQMDVTLTAEHIQVPDGVTGLLEQIILPPSCLYGEVEVHQDSTKYIDLENARITGGLVTAIYSGLRVQWVVVGKQKRDNDELVTFTLREYQPKMYECEP